MTFEELMDSTPPMQQHALVKGYQAGFAAGAANRDAEIAELVAALEEIKIVSESSVKTHGYDKAHVRNVSTVKDALAKVRKP